MDDDICTQVIEELHIDDVSEHNPQDDKLQLGILECGGRIYPLFSGENVIGRDNSCDITITPKDGSVSKRHAVIIASTNNFFIYDVGSLNGTFLGKDKLERNIRYNVDEKSDLKLGTVCITVKKTPKVEETTDSDISGYDSDTVLTEDVSLAVVNDNTVAKAMDNDENEVATQFDESEVLEPSVLNDDIMTQFDEDNDKEENERKSSSPLYFTPGNTIKQSKSVLNTEIEAESGTQSTTKRDLSLIPESPPESAFFTPANPANKILTSHSKGDNSSSKNLHLETQISSIRKTFHSPKSATKHSLKTETQLDIVSDVAEHCILDLETQVSPGNVSVNFRTPERFSKKATDILTMDTQVNVSCDTPIENILDLETQVFPRTSTTPSSSISSKIRNILASETQLGISCESPGENMLDLETKSSPTIIPSPFRTPGRFPRKSEDILLITTQAGITPKENILELETQAVLETTPSNICKAGKSQELKTQADVICDTLKINTLDLETQVVPQVSVKKDSILALDTQEDESMECVENSTINVKKLSSASCPLSMQSESTDKLTPIYTLETQKDSFDSLKECSLQKYAKSIVSTDVESTSKRLLSKEPHNKIISDHTSITFTPHAVAESSFTEVLSFENNKKSSAAVESDSEESEAVSTAIQTHNQSTVSSDDDVSSDESMIIETTMKLNTKGKVTLTYKVVENMKDSKSSVVREDSTEKNEEQGASTIWAAETQDFVETYEDESPHELKGVVTIPESQDIIESTPPASPVHKKQSIKSVNMSNTLESVFSPDSASENSLRLFYKDTDDSKNENDISQIETQLYTSAPEEGSTEKNMSLSQVETQVAPSFPMQDDHLVAESKTPQPCKTKKFNTRKDSVEQSVDNYISLSQVETQLCTGEPEKDISESNISLSQVETQVAPSFSINDDNLVEEGTTSRPCIKKISNTHKYSIEQSKDNDISLSQVETQLYTGEPEVDSSETTISLSQVETQVAPSLPINFESHIEMHSTPTPSSINISNAPKNSIKESKKFQTAFEESISQVKTKLAPTFEDEDEIHPQIGEMTDQCTLQLPRRVQKYNKAHKGIPKATISALEAQHTLELKEEKFKKQDALQSDMNELPSNKSNVDRRFIVPTSKKRKSIQQQRKYKIAVEKEAETLKELEVSLSNLPENIKKSVENIETDASETNIKLVSKISRRGRQKVEPLISVEQHAVDKVRLEKSKNVKKKTAIHDTESVAETKKKRQDNVKECETIKEQATLPQESISEKYIVLREKRSTQQVKTKEKTEKKRNQAEKEQSVRKSEIDEGDKMELKHIEYGQVESLKPANLKLKSLLQLKPAVVGTTRSTRSKKGEIDVPVTASSPKKSRTDKQNIINQREAKSRIKISDADKNIMKTTEEPAKVVSRTRNKRKHEIESESVKKGLEQQSLSPGTSKQMPQRKAKTNHLIFTCPETVFNIDKKKIKHKGKAEQTISDIQLNSDKVAVSLLADSKKKTRQKTKSEDKVASDIQHISNKETVVSGIVESRLTGRKRLASEQSDVGEPNSKKQLLLKQSPDTRSSVSVNAYKMTIFKDASGNFRTKNTEINISAPKRQTRSVATINACDDVKLLAANEKKTKKTTKAEKHQHIQSQTEGKADKKKVASSEPTVQLPQLKTKKRKHENEEKNVSSSPKRATRPRTTDASYSDTTSNIELVKCQYDESPVFKTPVSVKESSSPTSKASSVTRNITTNRRRSSSSDIQISEPSLTESTPTVVFSGYIDENQEKIVNRLGGNVVNAIPDSDCILIVKSLARTLKVLCILARGLPIVQENWIFECQKAGKFLDPWKYLIHDRAAEGKYGFKLRQCLEKRRNSHPVFEGWTILGTANTKPPPNDLQGVIHNAGGKFITNRPKIWPKQSLIVTCEEDKKSWTQLLGKQSKQHKPKLVTVTAIWESIEHQTVMTEEHTFKV